MKRVGVFVCHCGTNIASAVDVAKVAQVAGEMQDVVLATDYKFMCSNPGQKLIEDSIKEHQLDRVIVASCTPRLHESTFRKALERGGLNPYILEMANIREQCAWVHPKDMDRATAKAIDLVRMMVAKARRNVPLTANTIPLTKRVLVIGGGIAGMQAALDIADGGHEVVLVEREATIGGKMAMLDKTFPTLDCSA